MSNEEINLYSTLLTDEAFPKVLYSNVSLVSISYLS